MKILKKVLLAILIIVAIPFVIALFVKNDYAIEREVVISKPKQEVFDYVKFLKNQDNFSKWASMDSNMEKSFRGIDGTVGFVSAWSSEDDDVGVGEQEITSIADGERIEYELRFIKPFEA
ncbi:MAG: SRPBCC family protein, partial [Bacteroidales bacterium]|nr:SRPBCC family protein [Bacteroidales bacterium]